MAQGDFWKSVFKARDHRVNSLALPLLQRLEADPDYYNGCELSQMLTSLTGVDISYGFSVPEEHHAYWAEHRLRAWKTWLFSKEGRAFLEGGPNSERRLDSPEEVEEFLVEMLK